MLREIVPRIRKLMRRTLDQVRDGMLKAPSAMESIDDLTKGVLTEEMIQMVNVIVKGATGG